MTNSNQHTSAFPTGNIYMTRGVNAKVAADPGYSDFTLDCLKRHINKDWGEVCKEDWKLNDQALKDGDRILSAYTDAEYHTLWIITEADRSATTIILPEEY